MKSPNRVASASNSVGTDFVSCCLTWDNFASGSLGKGISKVWDQEVEWEDPEFKRLGQDEWLGVLDGTSMALQTCRTIT